MTDALDRRRKRLLFRSWHRGTKEADLLVGSFAECHLPRLDEAQLERYEALLEADDASLVDWITGRTAPPPERDDDVLRLLMKHKYTARSA
jgi:antitoxin CptB